MFMYFMYKMAQASSAGLSQQFVAFHLGHEEYAIPISFIQEIMRIPEITRIPGLPGFVRGVINLRGKIIPVISLAERFNIETQTSGDSLRIVVSYVDDKVIGLIVDSVSEVLRLSDETIEPVPPTLARIEVAYLKGVAKLEKRLVILIDMEKLFSGLEKSQLQKFVKDDQETDVDSQAPGRT